MIESNAATDGRKVGGDAATRERAAMLSVGDVAKMLKCSDRTVYRLSDAAKMPGPVRIGSLVRWSRAAIEAWIAEGCPSCRRGTGYVR